MESITKRLLLLLLISLGMWAGAKADDVSYVMRVHLVNGTVDEYLLADHPRVYFYIDTITIETKKLELLSQYLSEEIDCYTFVDASATSIEDTHQEEGNINMSVKYIDGENVVIRHIGSDAPIGVYSIDGKAQTVAISRTEDGADVSLSALPSGVYIINIKNKSIKVLKR